MPAGWFDILFSKLLFYRNKLCGKSYGILRIIGILTSIHTRNYDQGVLFNPFQHRFTAGMIEIGRIGI